jgi:hypothetical protein
MPRCAGQSLVELLAVLAILGMGVGVATVYFDPVEQPLRTGTRLAEGFLQASRARAMATTSAYRVTPRSATVLGAEYADSCSSTTWTEESQLVLELPEGVELDDPVWQVCFTSRGLTTTNTVIALRHPDEGEERLEVLLGGTTRVLP